ncbi:MAG: Rab family GTPase [Candidatus Odinarchaeota archaeon]
MPKSRIVLKMILIGDPGVGKTSLISQYVHGKFRRRYQLTIGLDVSSKDLVIDGREIRLSINDVGGQERFESIRHMFYTGSHLAMLVYDVTRPKSLERLINVWSKEVREFNPPRSNQPPMQMILVGNKCDLEDLRMTELTEGEEAAKLLGAIKHIETSAKDNKNVDQAFYDLTRDFLAQAGDI